MKIEIIAGSPRHNSVTRRVALFLGRHFSEKYGIETGIIDLWENPFPPVQKTFSSASEAPLELQGVAERILKADAYIVVTPEYNGSYSPAMQNMFDHFPKRHHKTFGLVTASPGGLGGIRAAMQLQQFVMALFGIPSPYMLVTPQVDKKFDAEGNLLDPTFMKNVEIFINEFLWLAERVAENAPVAERS